MPISRAGEEKLAREAREEELAKKELAREKKLARQKKLAKFFGESGALFLRDIFSMKNARTKEHRLWWEHFGMAGMPEGVMTALQEEGDARDTYNQEFLIEAKKRTGCWSCEAKDLQAMMEALEKGDASDRLKEAKADADAAFKKWKHALAPWLGARKNDGTLGEFQDALCALDLGGYKKGEYGCND